VNEDQKRALALFTGAALCATLGVALAARHYPGGFDWAYTVISRLASENRNPAGAIWLSGGFVASMLFLWPLTRHLSEWGQAGLPRPNISSAALRMGIIAGMLLGLEGLFSLDYSRLHRKGHEIVAILAFLGFYGGVLGLHLHRVRHAAASPWPALLVILPLLAVGITQIVLYFDQRDLGWVNTEWREMGIPIWLSFALWQWLAVLCLGIGLGMLVVARDQGGAEEIIQPERTLRVKA